MRSRVQFEPPKCPRMRPVLHLGIHRIDELADRNVEVVAVHEIDVDIVGLQPVERLVSCLRDDVGIVERRVRALADHHDVVALDAAARVPVAELLLGLAGDVDVAGVEEIAAALVEAVERDAAPPRSCGRTSKPSATFEAGLRDARDLRFGICVPPRGERRLASVWSRLGFSSRTFECRRQRATCRARGLPSVSAQLMPGDANSCLPARIASAAASASNE